MIKEDYVSYEVAKLLKDKGFDCGCIGYYVDYEPNDVHYSFCGETNSTWESRCCSAPTLQMTMKWLREKHNVCIIPSLYDGKGGFYCFVYTNNYRSVKVLNRRCNTYESACENAIKYCLETLI
jgi:hypothetical protein